MTQSTQNTHALTRKHTCPHERKYKYNMCESSTMMFVAVPLQALIDYYQNNTLEKIFPEVKTSLLMPYKDAST